MKTALKNAGWKAAEIGVFSTLLMKNAFAVGSGGACNGGPTALCQGVDNAAPTGAQADFPTIFRNVADFIIYLVGAIAVIMLIIGGLRYVTSAGNSSQVEGAKNTILYAIIGIVIAILAFAIVNFVITNVGK